jgi:hypothetical protein
MIMRCREVNTEQLVDPVTWQKGRRYGRAASYVAAFARISAAIFLALASLGVIASPIAPKSQDANLVAGHLSSDHVHSQT